MSTVGQSNGKRSSSSSGVNTPASTPVANGNGQAHSSPPPNNNAPKYGTLVPNRIFVGGISAQTTEAELAALFGSYGAVRAAKIIQDRAGVSKGYGFVTFESEDDARRPLRDADAIVLRERKLNVAPAIKKQPFSRAFDASSPPAGGGAGAGAPAPFFFPAPTGAGAAPYFQAAGVAYYPAPPPPPPAQAVAPPGPPGPPHGPPSGGAADHQQGHVYQPPPVYAGQTGPPQTATYPSMMFPQTIYMPQQYPLHMPYDYGYYQPAGAASPFGAATSQGSGGGGGPGSPPRQQQCGPGGGGGAGGPQQAMAAAGPPPYGELFYPAAALPMYGGHMDGVAPLVYGEGFDVMGPPPVPAGAVPAYAAAVEDSYTSPLTPMTTDGGRPPSVTPDASSCDGANSDVESSQRVAASATPVVSLLSIDHQQEKDYAAMQGGRRRKPPAATPSIPPAAFYPPSAGVFIPPPYHQMNGGNYNGYHHHHMRMGGGRRRVYGGERRQTAPAELSVDEEGGGTEEGAEGRGGTASAGATPPPPPRVYSPMGGQQQRLYPTRSYQPRPFKVNGGGGGGGRGGGVQHHHHHHQQMQAYGAPTAPQLVSVSAAAHHHHHPQAQQQQGQAQQAQRRGRRSIRRGPCAGPAGSEIGAGDAPLPPAPSAAASAAPPPPDDVGKKFEALKL